MAYTLPLLERFRDNKLFNQHKYVKYLVILPTRELCIQVMNEIESLKLHNHEFVPLAVYGGSEKRRQIDQIRERVDIIIATPGRLIDLL
jgi:ATP-dependent RNA helicase DeaD